MTTPFRLGALLFGFLVAFGAVEAGLRVAGMGFGSSPMEPDPHLHHVHPRNYTFVQQHPSGELGGFEIHYDGEGRVVRSPTPPTAADRPSGGCRVALLGDSFTEGGQVPFDVSFAGLLEEAGDGACDVRNYGVRSYSPAIYLVQWTREVRPWQPTHVLVLLYANDVREDVLYMESAVVGDDGWPAAVRGPSGGWLVSQLRRSYVARFARTVYMRASWAWAHRGEDQWHIGGVVEENPEWAGPTPGLVLELNRRVVADGARMVLMVVPSRYKLMGDGSVHVETDFHERVMRWAGEHDVGFLDLDSPFVRASRPGIPLFFRQDIHFNEEGHALTAAIIARAFPALFPGWAAITSEAVEAAFGDRAPR